MKSLFFAIPCVLFLGGVGAFFLFVPPLLIATVLIATVALPLTAFTLLYCFGIKVELQAAGPSDPQD